MAANSAQYFHLSLTNLAGVEREWNLDNFVSLLSSEDQGFSRENKAVFFEHQRVRHPFAVRAENAGVGVKADRRNQPINDRASFAQYQAPRRHALYMTPRMVGRRHRHVCTLLDESFHQSLEIFWAVAAVGINGADDRAITVSESGPKR